MTQTHHTTVDVPEHSVSMYVHEHDTEALLHAIYDADRAVVPDVGDSIAFEHAIVEGSMEAESLGISEYGGESTTYVVVDREIVYLSVAYDIDDTDERPELVSEVHLDVKQQESR